MMSEVEQEVGALRVGDLIEGLGGLGGRTLADLTGEKLTGDETSMIRKCVAAWSIPLSQMTWEQVRLLLGQGLGAPWTSMLALELLRRSPSVMVTFYPGDLSNAVLRSFSDVFAADPEGARGFLDGDFGWIDALAEGGAVGAEAHRMLASAKDLASNR